jgi:hypothetical protein
MRKYLIAVIIILSFQHYAAAQKIYEQYTKLNDSVRVGNGRADFLTYNDSGYTLILPDSLTRPKGILISLEDERIGLKANPERQIYPQATAEGFAVMYISTGVPVDLFFSEKSLRYVDKTISSTLKQFGLTGQHIFFFGVSLSGHRALKYIQYCRQGKGEAGLNIKGVVLCDSVLDWVRQWYEEKKGVKDNFAPSSVAEGKLVTYLLGKNLKGTPKTKLEAYLDFSPYSYFDERNRNLTYLRELAIRAYTEPATYYWMNERRKGVFDTNFPDMVGIINELKLTGNHKSELIIFHQGQENNDRRNPYYTWGLVDKEELVNWIATQIK